MKMDSCVHTDTHNFNTGRQQQNDLFGANYLILCQGAVFIVCFYTYKSCFLYSASVFLAGKTWAGSGVVANVGL